MTGLHNKTAGKLSLATILIIGLVLTYMIFNISKWRKLEVIQHDITQYYAYLPATFIFHDLKFGYVNKLPKSYSDKTWTLHTEDGSRVLKMPMGTAFFYLPFFLIGHLQAKISGQPTTGYSQPYEMWLCISSVFYILLGLFLMRTVLQKYFSETITSLVLLTIVFATNLLYYTTTEGTMSHAYGFFLFAGFLNVSINWREKPGWMNSVLLGIIGGLITLVRPNNIIVFLIPLFLKAEDWRNQIVFFSKYWKRLFVVGISFFIMISPQLIYWKYATGHWIYYSYQDQGFYFTQPQIINGLFSFRKGWLVYTPIMFLSIAGFFFMKELKEFRVALIGFFVLNIYVVFSWWCWWYGGSFGARSLIEPYALLAMPLAAFYKVCFKSKILSSVLVAVIIGFTTLNCFQTWQYRISLIHWDSMTKNAYWSVFGKIHFPENYSQLVVAPDYEKAKKGEKEY